jgi:Xaa-Pro aminopeptidase
MTEAPQTTISADEIRGSYFAAPVPVAELHRRWSEIREAMEFAGLDCLVVQSTSNTFGGYVRYLTDLAVGDVYPNTLIFPRAGEMTLIGSGPLGTRDMPSWMAPGVKEFLTGPYFPSVHYTDGDDATRAVGVLAAGGYQKVGIVAPGEMYASFGQSVRASLPSTAVIDATDLVDAIKSTKSPAEISLLEESVRIQDEVFAEVLDHIKPGMRAFELRAEVQRLVTLQGSEEQLIMIGVGPIGTAVRQKGIRDQYQQIQRGDAICLMIEANGPGGVYAEIGRTICLGQPSDELRKAWEDARELQDLTAGFLVPGADPAAVFATYNEHLTRKGYPPETRAFCHSQGYDIFERPTLNERETLTITAGMNMAIHPVAITANAYAFCCDNFLTSDTGPAVRLHRTPRDLFVI